jgi:hypothetical protein
MEGYDFLFFTRTKLSLGYSRYKELVKNLAHNLLVIGKAAGSSKGKEMAYFMLLVTDQPRGLVVRVSDY